MSTLLEELALKYPPLPPGSNPPPFAPPPILPNPTDETEADLRRWAMCLWARYFIGYPERIGYTEGPGRWSVVELGGTVWPKEGDCSSTVTALAKLAGASDPNGLDFTGGYTGTMLEHLGDHNEIGLAQARMGDIVVLGTNTKPTGQHVVFIMEQIPVFETPIAGPPDFWVFSQGGLAGDPKRYRYSDVEKMFSGFRVLRWVS